MSIEWSAGAVETGEGKPGPVSWEPVTVPGRPDQFAGEDRVAYRGTFSDPRDPDESMALVELRGTYATATVWLNDELVAESDAYFEPIRIPFEPERENELVVDCRAPEDRFGGIHDTDRVPDDDAVPGIWWEASVTTHPAAFVVDVTATPRLSGIADGDGAVAAAIETDVDVYAGEPLDDRLTLSTRPAGDRRGRGMMDRAAVEAQAGGRVTVTETIELRDPSLWWPRDVGPQHLYEIRAKLDDAVATTTTGLATVTDHEDGIAINGQPVPIRGVALEDGTVGDVDRALECNANLVRAHAHVLSPAIYEACDEAGVFVWQDLPLTGPGAFDVDRGRDLAARLADAYGTHPSLVAFGVHDEPTATFADGLGDGLVERLRLRWRAWRTDYDREPATAIAEAVPEGYPTYPVVGEPGTDPDAAALYPGWDYGSAESLSWLLGRYPGLGEVVGEFGAGSLGVAEPAETAGFDPAKHDARVDSTDVEASQANQAAVVGHVARTLRARETPVIVARALRDTADAGMGVYARDGTAKDGVATLSTAFEPVQALLADPDGGDSDVIVVNDTSSAIAGTLAWTAGDQSGETDVTVDPLDRTVPTTLSIPGDAPAVELELATDDHRVTNAIPL